MIPGSANALLLATAAGAGGYTISRSLRFNSADSAYLSRGFSSGDQTKWTWSCWCKPCVFSGDQGLFGVTGAVVSFIRFKNAQLDFVVNGATHRRTTAVFRDPSAWYHFVWAVDTSQSTASNRSRFYVNGVEVTTWSIDSALTQSSNTGISSNATHLIGSTDTAPNDVLNAYLASVHFIGAQQLDPTSFGEFDATTGVWNPIAYTGSYGTNGFHLDFADNSSAAALGYDAAGSNDWTVNNLSVTAGAGNDSLRDSPTNGDTANDTGLGGELPGNYATLNPLAKLTGTAVTLSNGNLDFSVAVSSNFGSATTTFGASSGKWYAEYTLGYIGSGLNGFGFINVASNSTNGWGIAAPADGWVRYGTAIYSNSTTAVSGLTSTSANDVIMLAVDFDAGKAWWGKNGTWEASGNPASGTNPTITFSPNGKTFAFGASAYDAGTSPTGVLNAGARAFAYTAPSGFKALCTANLPTPTIEDPSTVMDVVTYTGTGASKTITLPGAFNPDLVWIKSRDQVNDHTLLDVIRGGQIGLFSNLTRDERDLTSFNAGITSFNSDGFTLGADNGGFTNFNAHTYVGWCWDAGSSNATNTSGTITSTVRANISAGFSILTYTATNTNNATVGHGLGVAPELIIYKNRDTAEDWFFMHKYMKPGANEWNNYTLILNSTSATSGAYGTFNGTAPTSSVLNLSNITAASPNGGTNKKVMYCFAPVASYSAFGSYVGNSSSDGPFIFCNFRPKYVMVKAIDGARDWMVWDSERVAYNVNDATLSPNTSAIEATPGYQVDFLSNGFKLRASTQETNNSAYTYLYCAFAESPFAYSRAR